MAGKKETKNSAVKKESGVKTVLLPALALFLIAGVSAFLLAVVNNATKPIIEQREKDDTAAAMAVVAKDADSFSDEKTVTTQNGDIVYYEALDGSGNINGYVFTTYGSGYGGEIAVMTGIDSSGAITGIQLLSINETPGLGMRAQNEDFLNQYVGKSGALVLSKTASGDEIQALTGATITSKAVTGAVNNALSAWNSIAEGAE